MKDIFKDVMGIEGIHGIIVISTEGKLLLSKFSDAYSEEETHIDRVDWGAFVTELDGSAEVEFVFEKRRFYIRRSQSGYLLVVLDDIAPISMVRLNCEILLPTIDRMKPSGKISQILRKKIF